MFRAGSRVFVGYLMQLQQNAKLKGKKTEAYEKSFFNPFLADSGGPKYHSGRNFHFVFNQDGCVVTKLFRKPTEQQLSRWQNQRLLTKNDKNDKFLAR